MYKVQSTVMSGLTGGKAKGLTPCYMYMPGFYPVGVSLRPSQGRSVLDELMLTQKLVS